MEDKRATGHERRPDGKQHSRHPLTRLLRDNLRVSALLSSLVASGGSTNWK
jgi:hypothetical protein